MNWISRLTARPRNTTRRQMAEIAALSHEGVSCDGCMMPNFSGCRYKCLRCWDFDLCHTCFINERFQVDTNSDQQHDREHPMQCILSHHDFEVFYADDDTRNYSVCRIAVLTCPYCGERGFGYTDFYEHVMRQHEEPMTLQVNCPLCIGLVDSESSHRVVDNLKTHWASTHYQYDPALATTLTSGGGGAGATAADAALPPAAAPGARATRANAAAAALAAAEAAMGGAAATGPFDLPPTARNGARRPMMARRAARQQPGADRTDRENRTENREQRNAAAAFGMPWTDNDEVQDLFRAYRLVQRNANDPTRATNPITRDRERMQRLRTLQQTMAQTAPGNLVASADFIQQIMGGDYGRVSDAAPSYAGLVRGLNPEAAGEYAAPRAHHGLPVAPRSRTPPVQVVVGLGSRPMTANQYDAVRQEEAEQHERSPSVSTLTSGDVEGTEDEEAEEQQPEAGEGEEAAARPQRTTSSSSSSSEESEAEEEKEDEEEEDEDATPRPNTDTQRTAEDDAIDALTKQQAIADTTLTQEEITDMRRAEDPFAVRLIDPLKAIRANATNREWKVIKRMLKNNDLRAKDEAQWLAMNEDGRMHRMDEEAGDSEDEIIVDNLHRVRPAGPKDEEDYRNMWLTVKTDTSGLSFARDSYWKDKRYITPRKLERQQSVATVDEAALTKNALKSLSIARRLAGGKVLPEEVALRLTQGEEMKQTLGLWDMRDVARREEGEGSGERARAEKCDEAVHAASRGLDLDYDSAMLTVLKNEADAIEKELASQVGSPPSAMARARLEKQKKYLESLRAAGAGGGVVLQNPRDDPVEQAALDQRLREMWGTDPIPHRGPLPRLTDQPGASH